MNIRTRKSKGFGFEYDVYYNLNKKFKDTYLTKQQGFNLQYDLQNDKHRFVIECKFHRSFTWNELKKLYDKLTEKAPKRYKKFLIFKSNRQPVLVMYKCEHNILHIAEFEDLFKVKFEKHKPIKKR